MTAPFVRGVAVQPGRGGAEDQDPRMQGDVRLLTSRARAFEDELRSAEAERHGTCARVPADQSAPLPISGPLIGRSDPSEAQGSGAKSGGTRHADCGDSLLSAAAAPAVRVTGATSAGRPASGDHQRQLSARLLAGQLCGAIARELLFGDRGRVRWRRLPFSRREATLLARGAPRPGGLRPA